MLALAFLVVLRMLAGAFVSLGWKYNRRKATGALYRNWRTVANSAAKLGASHRRQHRLNYAPGSTA